MERLFWPDVDHKTPKITQLECGTCAQIFLNNLHELGDLLPLLNKIYAHTQNKSWFFPQVNKIKEKETEKHRKDQFHKK